MRTLTPLAPPAPPSPPPPRGAQPPAPEASAAPFAAVLDDHQARTAVAEGQTPKRPSGPRNQTQGAPVAGDPASDRTAPATQPARDAPATAAAPPVPLVDPAPAAIPTAM